MAYNRNPSAIKSMLIERGSQCIAKKDVIVHVPVRFTEVGLAELSGRTYVYGLFPIIDAVTGEYAVLNACTMVELSPSKVLKTIVADEEYYELYFYAGSVLISDMNCVKKDTLPYSIIDEVIFKGKVPWYIDYVDLGKIYDTSRAYANSNVGESSETVEFIASLMYRSIADRTKYAREVMTKYDEHDKMTYIPLKSVIYAANNTLNKLTGSYFKDGVNSAIVNPTKKVEAIESILRA